MSISDADLWLPSDAEMALMTEAQLHEVAEILYALRRKDEEEWLPQPKQELATRKASETAETLYGGAAGGGKSEWLLHYVLDQMLAHPFNRGAIFRRVFPSLERTLIPRSKQMYPKHGGIYNAVKHSWTFPNGSVLEMGSLQHEDSVLEHQGAEYGIVAFEEVTEFAETQVEYMIGRLRAPGPGIRPHLVATANPGGRGHRWVKRRWVKPKDGDFRTTLPPVPYQIWQPTATKNQPNPGNRVFIPATLEDNPILEARDPGYRDRLRALAGNNVALAKAMENGDWDAIDAVEGALWSQLYLDAGRISLGRFKQDITVVRRLIAVDPSDGNEDGHGDEYGVAVIAIGADGVGYVEFSEGWRASPNIMVSKTLQLAAEMGCDEIVVEKNHGGKWLKTVFRSKDRYCNVKEVWASDGKITRARPVAALFEYDHELAQEGMPFRAKLVGSHPELEDELTTYTGEPGELSPNRMDALVWAISRGLLGIKSMDEQHEYTDKRHDGRR